MEPTEPTEQPALGKGPLSDRVGRGHRERWDGGCAVDGAPKVVAAAASRPQERQVVSDERPDEVLRRQHGVGRVIRTLFSILNMASGE